MVLERPLNWTAWALEGADAARLLKPLALSPSRSTAASSRYEGQPQHESIAVWRDTRSLTEDLRRSPRAMAMAPWVSPLQLQANGQQDFAEAALNRLAWLQAEKEVRGLGCN